MIWGALPLADGTWNPRVLLDVTFQISSFGEDMNGEVYVVDYNRGRIHQIEDAIPPAGHRRVVRR
jgi:hypothetical protein